MKANSPKRKVFQDALDLLTEDMAVDKAVSENGILQIAIDKITPFHDHPLVLKAYRLMLALPYTPEYTSERSMICCLSASAIPGAVEE